MTCRCDAYPFPHRQGGGDCPGTPYCPDCGSHEATVVQHGWHPEYGAWHVLCCDRCGAYEEAA